MAAYSATCAAPTAIRTAIAAPRRSLRTGYPPLLQLLCIASALLLLCVSHTAHAAVYTTTLSIADAPAATRTLAGLNYACSISTNASAVSADNRTALEVRSSGMSTYMSTVTGLGTFYVAAYYNATLGGWFWVNGLTGTVTQFGSGPSSQPVTNLLVLNWAAGYPVTASSTSVGSAIYVVYDGAAKGWKNVDGTESYDGVVCECPDRIAASPGSKFPWWAILVIAVGSAVLLVAIVVAIVVLCCRGCCCGGGGRSKADDDYDRYGSDEEMEDDYERRYGRNRKRMTPGSDSRSYYARSNSSRTLSSSRRPSAYGMVRFDENSSSGTYSYSYSYSDSLSPSEWCSSGSAAGSDRTPSPSPSSSSGSYSSGARSRSSSRYSGRSSRR